LTPADVNRYLDYAMEALVKRRETLIQTLKGYGALPQIDDDEAVGDADYNVKLAAALARSGEAHRKDTKEPFLEGGRTVDAWFKRWLAPLSEAMTPVQAAMDRYGIAKEDRLRLEAEANAAEAQAEVDRLTTLASDALRKGHMGQADRTLAQVEAAALIQEAAEASATRKSTDLTRVTGAFGGSTSLRTTWDFSVEDISIVPREYLMIDADMVKAVMKRRDRQGNPTAVIPGIAWVPIKRMR
jgi:hypothetical protein